MPVPKFEFMLSWERENDSSVTRRWWQFQRPEGPEFLLQSRIIILQVSALYVEEKKLTIFVKSEWKSMASCSETVIGYPFQIFVIIR